jgi:hypothetical protein
MAKYNMYVKINEFKRCKLKVYKDGTEIYSGSSEEAPDEIKDMYYNAIKLESGFVILEV